jgi:hypothetical protein
VSTRDLSKNEKKMVRTALKVQGTPAELSEEQWCWVSRLTLATKILKSDSSVYKLSGSGVGLETYYETMIWWLKRFLRKEDKANQDGVVSELWRCIVLEVLRDLGKAVGNPWKWLYHMDRRPSMSLGNIKDAHDVTLALTDQWLEDMGCGKKVPRRIRGGWMVPHLAQMSVVKKMADAHMESLLKPTYLPPTTLKAIKINAGDFVAVSDIQMVVEIVLHDHLLDRCGTSPDDATACKLSGDAGKLSQHIMATFCAFIMTDSRKRDPISGRISEYLQSTDELFALACILASETGLLWHEGFSEVMLWFKGVQEVGYFDHSRLNRRYYLNIVNTTDLSTTQKICGHTHQDSKGQWTVKSNGAVTL